MKKADITEAYYNEKERQRNLVRDKRVKHIKECDFCKAIISRNKYLKNGGYCDTCINNLY